MRHASLFVRENNKKEIKIRNYITNIPFRILIP